MRRQNQLEKAHSGIEKGWKFCREDREDFDLKAAEGGSNSNNGGKRGRQDGAGGGGGGGGGGVTAGGGGSGRRVFVNNLAEETTWQALKDYFKQAGAVAHADVLAVRPLRTLKSS